MGSAGTGKNAAGAYVTIAQSDSDYVESLTTAARVMCNVVNAQSPQSNYVGE